MPQFVRIKLSFANVWHGQPRECWFLLDHGICRNVLDLHYLIKKRFELPVEGQDLQLYLDGCLLPPQERIEIIRDNDLIK